MGAAGWGGGARRPRARGGREVGSTASGPADTLFLLMPLSMIYSSFAFFFSPFPLLYFFSPFLFPLMSLGLISL